VFLPLARPHAFIIRSLKIRMLTLITPGGFMKVVAPMAAPAQNLVIQSDSVTYATADLAETMEIFEKHGLRFLSPEEITHQMPAFRYAQPRNPWRGRRQESYSSLQQYAKARRRDTDMQDMSTQSEDEFRITHISGAEEKNRRLKILVSELLQTNHELRLEVAHLHDKG
jgi:hypothetical protein